jgi:hypothetical protein
MVRGSSPQGQAENALVRKKNLELRQHLLRLAPGLLRGKQ